MDTQNGESTPNTIQSAVSESYDLVARIFQELGSESLMGDMCSIIVYLWNGIRWGYYPGVRGWMERVGSRHYYYAFWTIIYY